MKEQNDPLEVIALTPRVRSWFARRTWNEHDVEDLTQETLLRCLKSLSRIHGQVELAAWCYGVCKNVWSEYVRSAVRDVELRDPDLVGDHRNTEERLVVDLAAAGLSRRLMVVYDLRYQNDLPVEVIAQILDRPVGTIKYQLKMVRDYVRRRLD